MLGPTAVVTVLLGAAVLAGGCLFFAIRRSSRRCVGEPPHVPFFVPYFGSALSFSAHPLAFLSDCRRRYGPLFTVLLAGTRFHFVCDPHSYSAVIKHPQLTFQGLVHAVATHVFGQSENSVGVDAVDKEVHNQWIQHLSGQGLNEMVGRAHRHLRRWMEEDREGRDFSQPISLYQVVDDAMTYTAVRSLYGEGWHIPSVQSRLHRFDSWFPYILLRLFPDWILRPGLRARDELRGLFLHSQGREDEAPLTKARRALFQAHNDRYSAKDAASAETAMMVASVINSVPSAFWTLTFLLHHPEALAAVKREVDAHLPRTPLGVKLLDDGVWTKKMCNELTLTHSAMLEAMRLRAQTMVARVAAEDCALTMASGETSRVRKGDWVALFLPLTSLDDTVFVDPLSYQYDRFSSQPSGSQSLPTSSGIKPLTVFLPFGAGYSICPGRHWATTEILMLVALVLQHCHIVVAGDGKIPEADKRKLGIMPPLRPLMVTMRYES